MLTRTQFVEEAQPLPVNPNTPTTLLQVLDDPTVGADVLLPTVECDVNLTAGLLRICNSCLFAGNREIGSVREALVRVGNMNFARIAFIVSLEPVFSREMIGFRMGTNDLWRHSMAVAYASSRFAVAMGAKGAKERAFTAGILHDIGKLAMDQVIAEKRIADPFLRLDLESERGFTGVDHAEIGGAILDEWKLPAEVVDGVRFHHEEEYVGEHQDIVRCVRAADVVIKVAQERLDPAEAEESLARFKTWGLSSGTIEDTRSTVAEAGNDILPVLLARRR
jgi:putative nucleotidyltransferase with HDIG domain